MALRRPSRRASKGRSGVDREKWFSPWPDRKAAVSNFLFRRSREGASSSRFGDMKMTRIPRRSQAAKEQSIRLARMMTASTGVTPEGFSRLCRAILRDSRREDFQEIYGEPPALLRSRPAICGDA
jgi:hypothetical protein